MKTDLSDRKLAFQLKGSMYTLTLLQLINPAPELVRKQLETVITQAPKLFHNAPIIIDLSLLTDEIFPLKLSDILPILRENNLYPIAITGGNPEQQFEAQKLNLAILSSKNNETKLPTEITRPSEPTAPNQSKTLLVTQPVRSGQQIYAKDSDLIVVAQVSHGAELLADGNIHVYGTLRGKALAGISGDKQARIFCHQLEAELLAIAGVFQLSEDYSTKFGHRSLQVFLEEDRLSIAGINE